MLTFEHPGAQGETIHGYLHTPEEGDLLPVVLLAHGFKGFADYGFLPMVADRLAEAGFAVVRFNFSHSGVSNAEGRFDRPDLFEKDTFANQVADVLALIEAIRDDKLPAMGRLDAGRIGMVGHSRGGVTAVLATGSTDVLKAVVTLGSPDCTLHDQHLKTQLRALGRVSSPSARTGQQLFIGRAIVDDIDGAGERYDLRKLLSHFAGALMAVHCENDQTVNVRSAETLTSAHAAGPTELVILPKGSHTFDFEHGQSGTTATLEVVIEKVLAFLNEHLKQPK